MSASVSKSLGAGASAIQIVQKAPGFQKNFYREHLARAFREESALHVSGAGQGRLRWGRPGSDFLQSGIENALHAAKAFFRTALDKALLRLARRKPARRGWIVSLPAGKR
jgi:hypothetical protein